MKAEPDLFLMMSLRPEVGRRGQRPARRPRRRRDDAPGINSCVVDMSDYQILSFGPQFPATLDALADAIYSKAAPAMASAS